METERFDEFTRRLSGADVSRRQALGALAGALLAGAVGGVAARLGLTEVATAKPKKHKAKPKRPSPAERQAQSPLQAEGKGNRKGNGKGKPGKNKPKPPPKPVCDNALPRCPDGSCRQWDQCCPGSRRCADGSCHKEDQCCPSERRCPDGPCVSVYDGCACPGEKECADGSCISVFECCATEYMCPDGSCVDADDCCSDEKLCDDGSCVSQDECCPGMKMCPNRRCYAEKDCCPPDPQDPAPLCANCYYEVCENGGYVCRGPDIFACECPAGGFPCPPVPPRTWVLPDGWLLEMPQGCCPDYHTGWDHTTGQLKCLEEVGSGDNAGTICW